MTIPFEQIGPNQVGRLVYQVIGKEGPIFNPKNIKYLPPSDATKETGFVSDLAMGFSGLNLIASCANLGISVAISKEISQIHNKIDQLSAVIGNIDSKTDTILSKIERIDTKVAENNLRHSIKHVMDRALMSDGIDVERLASLGGDIDSFVETIEKPLLLNHQIRLSSDVRENLAALTSFLFHLRLMVAAHHNAAVKSDPLRVIAIDPELEYFGSHFHSNIFAAIAFDKTLSATLDTVDKVNESINDRFSFSDDSDTEHFSQLFLPFTQELDDAFEQNLPISTSIHANLPDNFFKNKAQDDVFSEIISLSTVWLWNNDGGLIFRAQQELLALNEGYDNIFWFKLLDQEDSPIKEIFSSCSYSA